MKFDISILEYLGKMDIGILVLISIMYDGKYYEGTFFYTSDKMVLTISEDLEKELQHSIEQDEEYEDILRTILRKIVPYDEIYNRIDEIDPSKWEITGD